MPYMHVGKTVYKKNPDGSRGKKVGTTTGSVKKYMAALYAHSPDAKKHTTQRGKK
jgi:hypothetical protein